MKTLSAISTILLLTACTATSQGPPQKCTIAISPEPVPLNTPWNVLVSGLKSGQDNIVMGNGWNDGNWMYHKYYTASPNGNIAETPPPFQIQTVGGQTLDPTGQHDFQVLQMTGGGGSKLLCDQWYNVGTAKKR